MKVSSPRRDVPRCSRPPENGISYKTPESVAEVIRAYQCRSRVPARRHQQSRLGLRRVLATRDQMLLCSSKFVSNVWVGCICQCLIKQLIYAMEVVARHTALAR